MVSISQVRDLLKELEAVEHLERKTVLLLATGSSSDAEELPREEKIKRKGNNMFIVILQDWVITILEDLED